MVELASLDGRSALDLLAAGASRLGRDVVGSFVGVHLAAEVDGQTDEEDHHEAGQGQPDGDGAALVVPPAHRSRQVSIGLDMVARMTREPGTPGTARSERFEAARDGDVDRAGHARLLVEVGGVDGDVDARAADLLVGDARDGSLASVGACRLRVARERGRPGAVGGSGLERLMGARRTPAEDDQADEQREGRYADRRFDRRRSPLVPSRHGVPAALGAVSRSTGTVALCVIRTFHPGITLRLNPVTVTVAVVAVRLARRRGSGEYVVTAGLGEEVVGRADAVGLAPLLGAGRSGALLRGRDGHRPRVVEERGLHPEEHDREERGQQDDELDRDRAPLDRAAGSGYLMLPDCVWT